MGKKNWLQRQIVIMALTVVIPCSLLISLSFRSIYTREQQNINNLNAQAQGLSLEFNRWYEPIEHSKDLVAYALQSGVTTYQLQTLLDIITNDDKSHIKEIALYDEAGVLLAQSVIRSKPTQAPWNEWVDSLSEYWMEWEITQNDSTCYIWMEPDYSALIEPMIDKLKTNHSLGLSMAPWETTLFIHKNTDDSINVSLLKPYTLKPEKTYLYQDEYYEASTGFSPLDGSNWWLVATGPTVSPNLLKAVKLLIFWAAVFYLTFVGYNLWKMYRYHLDLSQKLQESLDIEKIGGFPDKPEEIFQMISDLITDFHRLIQASRDKCHELALLYEQSMEQNRQIEQALAKNVSAQEDERRRLAREIHDWMNDHLVNLNYNLQYILKNSDSKCNSDCPLSDQLSRLREDIVLADNELRRIMNDLHPHLLDTLGLEKACHSYLEQFQKRTGIPCSITISGDLEDIASFRQLVLFRIFQEGLTNVGKHSQATRVDVELTAGKDEVLLKVTDNGVGFVNPRQDGLGLTAIKERAKSVKGSIYIESAPNQGTMVCCTIPLNVDGGEGKDDQDSAG
jgi:signal transduction histidine kinase